MIGIVIANKRGRWLPICLVLHSANGMMISLDQSILPHIFVWGSCFWFCIPLLLPLRRLPDTHTQLCHAPSFTHNFVTHHLSHTSLSHTIFYTQLCHTPLCHTHHLSHTTLSHTSLSHTIFYKQLGHTRSFTHNFVTHTHTIFQTQLCHTPSFTHNFVTRHLSHTALSHTLRGRGGTRRRGRSICVAGVALGDVDVAFAWHAWHLWHWAGMVAHLLHRADRRDVVCHLVGRGCGCGKRRVLSNVQCAQAASSGRLVCHRQSLTHTHTTWSHTQFFTHDFVTHIFHTHSFITHNSSHTILHHLLYLSFLLRPASTFVSVYWKKLTCGVIRSFIFLAFMFSKELPERWNKSKHVETTSQRQFFADGLVRPASSIEKWSCRDVQLHCAPRDLCGDGRLRCFRCVAVTVPGWFRADFQDD